MMLSDVLVLWSQAGPGRDEVGPGEELMVVSGIQEWARRLRELRVQFGWSIASGVTVKQMEEEEELPAGDPAISGMKPSEYILLSTEQDRDAAHRWNVANGIRKKKGSVQSKILDFLRANGFRTYIVSGGGIEFMRAWVEDVYGIPPEQVIGSTIETTFEMREGGPVLVRIPKVDFLDEAEGKPVGIHKFIGRRPILAFGNSDGDHQMLQWTAAGGGARFMGLVHHTDGEREWAYDRESHVGRLDKALDEAREKGWTVLDMHQEWRQVFPWE